MKKILPVILLLAILGAGAWYYVDRIKPAHEPLQLHGNVDIRGVDLGFRVSGRVVEVLKDEGDLVKAGDILARIDQEPYQRALEQTKASLASAEAQARLKKAGYRPEEIEQARATLAQNRVAADNAEKAYKRQADLVKQSSVSRQEYENSEAARNEAIQRVRLAEANLNQLEAGYRTEEIDAANAAVDQAKAAVGTAEIQLADTVLKAPSDAVLITRAVESGAIVQAGATVLSLSLEKPVWVRAYVAEPDLGKFPSGTKVELFTDGKPDHAYHGTVGFVAPSAEFTPKSVETKELRTSLVYRMRVVVDDSDGSLRQGMPVTLRLPNTPAK
ncbi:MAG: secretion protein HlyD [Luteolibacter sp.]